jgi:CDP-diglyceride synthetase
MPLVFHPFSPLKDLSELVAGTVMIVAASTVIHRIYSKSKNPFAYTLMGLTVTMGIANVGLAFDEAFRREVTLQDNHTYHFASEYS